MYTLRTNCRACDFGKSNSPAGTKSAETPERLVEAFDLGVQPLANDFRNEAQEHAGYAPLKVMFCPRCTNAQLSVVVSPEILYSNYAYVTSKSQTMQRHFRSLWFEILKETAAESLVEIGSNDGDFLVFAMAHGASRVMGIDPAQNLSEFANQRGVQNICAEFNSGSARLAFSSMARPDVIVARHVFCHINDWKEFMAGLEILAGDQTLVVIEAPYVVDLLKNVEFDTIYHEHLDYISITAMRHLLSQTQFHLHKIIQFPIHGGALAIMLRHNKSRHAPDSTLDWFDETITIETWKEFERSARNKIQNLSRFVLEEVGKGKTICGFGASAKSTVWINACKFSRKQIKFICDCTPYKQYTFSPGSDIPIVDEGALLRELPDVCINFAWNFHAECLEKNKLYLEKGGKIVNPYQLCT